MNFENLDSAIIEDHEWAQDLRKFLHAETDKYVLNWCKVVIELGVGDQYLNEWIDIFKGQIEERFKELVEDVVDMKGKLLDEISELLAKTQNYANDLGLKEYLNEINPKEKYFQVKSDLVKRSERLKVMMEKRQKEVSDLMEKQKELCNILEKTPYELPVHPLPRKEEIENVQQYVESLEQEKFNREEGYLKLKEAIGKLAEELDLTPRTDFERDILSETNRNFNITETNMKQLQKCHDDLVQQLSNRKEEIDHLRSNINELWNILEESMSTRHLFHEENSGYSSRTLKALKEEVKRCEELKKANIKVFVDKIKNELHQLWVSCYHKNDEKQASHQWLTSDIYTEDLLSYLELEVRKWRNFHDKHGKLIKLFSEHQELWNRLVEMENKDSAGPNRYKNRGGELLKEEKERNKLSVKIPQLEERIKQLAQAYEDHSGVPFMIFGTPVLEYIDNLHLEREERRKVKVSARKQNRDHDTITPAKSSLSVFPSCSRMLLTPQTSSVKRKLPKPIFTGKKPKLEASTPSSMRKNLIPSQPATLSQMKRKSLEKIKKLRNCRKALIMSKNKENENDTISTNYDDFEKNMSSRVDNCRSTLKPEEILKPVPAINVIPCTPSKNNEITSQKTPSRTPSNLKLIF